MTEYNLSNDHDARFYQFQSQFLNQIKNLTNGNQSDFTFIYEQVEEAEKLLKQTGKNDLKYLILIQNIKINFKNIEKRINDLAIKVKDFTPDHVKKVQRRIIEFENSMVHLPKYKN